MGKKDRGRHNHLGRQRERSGRTSTTSPHEMQRIRNHNLTKEVANRKSIHFAGHIISDKGIRPDDEKYAAIKRFPSPKDVKDLRSFLGLATQLGSFIPDLAHITNELRPLLKKGIAWQWTEDTEEHFVKAKNLLTSNKTICLLYTSPSPRDRG